MYIADYSGKGSERCFQETGFCISGTIRNCWEKNGGLPVFGYPISAQNTEANNDGWVGPTQWCRLWALHNQETNALRLSAQSVGHGWRHYPHFELMSTNADQRDAARDLLESKRDLTVIDNKGFVKAELAFQLLQRCNIRLLTLPRSNQKQQVSGEVRRLFNSVG